MTLNHVSKYVHCDPSMIDWLKWGNIAKMLHKVCKKFSDPFASSLWTWSSEKSGPFCKVSSKSDKGLWRFCKSIFAVYFQSASSLWILVGLKNAFCEEILWFSLEYVHKYVHRDPGMIVTFAIFCTGKNIKMLQKVCKKWLDQFASSLWTWSLQESGP